MKTAPSEASSDLARAQALSRALSEARAPRGPAPSGPSAPGYTRLSARAVGVLPPLEPGARWPRIVDWLRGAAHANAVFAVDRTGLVIASVGLEDDEAMRIGGRVALAFDQSSLVDEVRSLVIDWAGDLLTAIEVRDPDDVPILIGVLGHRGAVPRVQVVAAIVEALSG